MTSYISIRVPYHFLSVFVVCTLLLAAAGCKQVRSRRIETNATVISDLQFCQPNLARLSNGTVYFGGFGENLKKLDSTGKIETLPIPTYRLTKDINENIYVASIGYIVKIKSDGSYEILAGKAPDSLKDWGDTPDVDGVGAQVQFGPIQAITADGRGNVYIQLARMPYAYIKKIDENGKATTVVSGVRISNFSNNWAHNAFAANREGELFIGGRGAIIKIHSNGDIEEFVGRESETLDPPQDGQGREASFGAEITRLAIDSSGNIYAVIHDGVSLVRKITSQGFASTLAGRYAKMFPVDEDIQSNELVDGNERGNSFYPFSNIDVDSDGNVYFLQCSVNALRKLSSTGQVTTLIRGEPNPPGW